MCERVRDGMYERPGAVADEFPGVGREAGVDFCFSVVIQSHNQKIQAPESCCCGSRMRSPGSCSAPLRTYTVEWTGTSANNRFDIDLYYCGSYCVTVSLVCVRERGRKPQEKH